MLGKSLVALILFLGPVAHGAKTTTGRVRIDNSGALNLDGTNTDSKTIADTALVVDQKSGPAPDAKPNLPPVDTTITALDGQLVNASIPSASRRSLQRRVPGRLGKRNIQDDYEVVFSGTGTNVDSRDGSIQGTAYMTFTTVDNSTYNIDECLHFCSSVQGCVFANLYYEFNNPGLDASSSNLKCALYGDVHTADEKTNTGGQQQYPEPGGLTYVQQSSGFAAKSIEDPETPEGYELVGLFDGANNAPGYMGFAFLSTYDVGACSQLCNDRGADPNGGGCQYFNIWRALVNGNPTTYTCSFYYIPSDASTANNYGQGDLKVTLSRGYRRISAVVDGGFEDFPCEDDFCFAESTPTWIGSSPEGGSEDALIFHFAVYAHSGTGVGTLGSGDGTDSLPGTFTPAQPLNTIPGRQYSLQFFHNSAFNDELETDAFFSVTWNGVTIASIHPGNSPWTFFEFNVGAQGNDILQISGGSYPAYDFIDDINLFLV